MDNIFSDDTVILIGTTVGVLLFTVLAVLKARASNDQNRQAELARVESVIDKGIPIAFNVVQEIARLTPNKVDDKVALGLKALADYAATHGVTPTEDHEDRAKLVFQAMHAESKAATAEAR